MVWITCGLLRCFYQLFGLSFWRHPFTAEHPLLSLEEGDVMLHLSKTDKETNSSTSWKVWGWVQYFHFWVNSPMIFITQLDVRLSVDSSSGENGVERQEGWCVMQHGSSKRGSWGSEQLAYQHGVPLVVPVRSKGQTPVDVVMGRSETERPLNAHWTPLSPS